MNFWERYDECMGDGSRSNSNQNNRQNNNQGCEQNAGRNCGGQGFTEQDVRRKYEQYSGKNENQLMSELAETVARMKSEGSFDPQAIENMYNTAAPFLNDMQRQRMRYIIDTLVK